jgi:hypothetical protein
MPIGERVKRGLNLPSQEISFVKHEARFYTVKRLTIFPSPAGMSLTKLSLAGNDLIIPGQVESGK